MAARKIVRKSSAKKTHFIVANYHTGPIVIPQRKGQNSSVILIRTAPIIIPPGKGVPIDAEIWTDLKKNKGIQNYMDAGLIGEIEREGEVPVNSRSTVTLPIPENLLRDDEKFVSGIGVSAKVTRKDVKNIPVGD
jgi:hypothetical protein